MGFGVTISEATIRSAQAGDARAQSGVIEALYPAVHKHLSFSWRFHPDVDEAVQESMIEILRALPSFRFRAALRTWALRIAGRTAHRFFARQRKHTDALTVDGAAPELPYELDGDAADDVRLLGEQLARLAPKKREAFVLMEILGLSAKEAGHALGTFANTAASRHRHAKAELQQAFSGFENRTPGLTNSGGGSALEDHKEQ